MIFMFSGCKKLTSIKNILPYNMENLTYMVGVFKDCKNLGKIPDLSKWNTIKVEKAKGLFSGCENLKIFSGANLWKFKKEIKLDEILENSTKNLKDSLKSSWENNQNSGNEIKTN